MKKKALLLAVILALVLAVVLTGPVYRQVSETNGPMSDRSEANSLDENSIDYFQKLLERNADNPWYNAALGCIYSAPEDLNLALLFYQGFSAPDGVASDEELEYLLAQGFADGIVEIQRLPVHKLEEVLSEYFDISLSDVQIPGNWMYYEKTDCYYSSHNDAYIVSGFTVTKVQYNDDIVSIHYTMGPYSNGADDPLTGDPVTEAVLTLKETAGGSFIVLSNTVWREI